MKNTLGDLSLHLFAQLERLGDEDLKNEKLSEEIERAKAVTLVATKVIENGALVLQAQKVIANSFDANIKIPRMLEG